MVHDRQTDGVRVQHLMWPLREGRIQMLFLLNDFKRFITFLFQCQRFTIMFDQIPRMRCPKMSITCNISISVVFCSGMGSSCCKLFQRQTVDEDNVVDLPYPIECVDNTDENQVTPAQLDDDFIDLREDLFPVQCTELSHPILPPKRQLCHAH